MKIRKNDDLLGLDTVMVIGASGEKLGVMAPADALRLAREQGLDLVEVNPKAKPPHNYDAFRKIFSLCQRSAFSLGRNCFLSGTTVTDGGKTWVNAPGTMQAKTVIPGFTPGATVQFRYRPLTKIGEGDWSQVASLIIK